jgi:hypothetical protein
LSVAEAQAREGIGRSRGGLTTKVHTLADGRGRSLATLITPGQAADTRQLIPLLEHVRVARSGGPGPAPHAAGVGDRRQGVLVTGEPAGAAR